MRVGIDIQHLQVEPRGIYYYLWSMLDKMCRIDHPHRLGLYCYGQARMDPPEDRRLWRQTAQQTLEAYEEAWRRFRLAGRRSPSLTSLTRYRELMRQWAIDEARAFTWRGQRICTWPFSGPRHGSGS
jgi:hypothetical protein